MFNINVEVWKIEQSYKVFVFRGASLSNTCGALSMPIFTTQSKATPWNPSWSDFPHLSLIITIQRYVRTETCIPDGWRCPSAHFTDVWSPSPTVHDLVCFQWHECTFACLNLPQNTSKSVSSAMSRTTSTSLACRFEREWQESLRLVANAVGCVHTHNGLSLNASCCACLQGSAEIPKLCTAAAPDYSHLSFMHPLTEG